MECPSKIKLKKTTKQNNTDQFCFIILNDDLSWAGYRKQLPCPFLDLSLWNTVRNTASQERGYSKELLISFPL